MTWTSAIRALASTVVLAATGATPLTAQPVDVDLDFGDVPSVIDADQRRSARLDAFIPRENTAFFAGERLTYSVKYGPIRAGECRLEVGAPVVVEGRPCLPLVGTARSSDFFSSIFRVEDRMESFLDVDYLLPWRFRKNLQEGKFRANQVIDLDQVNRVATYHDGAAIPLDPEAQDVLSALFYIRTLDLSPGRQAVFRVHADKKNVDMELHVLGRERVDTDAGKFDCLVVEPLILLDSGLYDHKKGKLVMYLTDDARKLPVQFKIKVFFGSIVLSLTELTEGVAQNG